jgi:hypothetical protein
MGLAPLPHMLGVFRAVEVVATEGSAPPSALAGLFAGVLASGLAAVMLPVPVAVIGEEKLAATAALTSLRLLTHRGSKPPRSRKELKQNQPKGRRASREEGRRILGRSSGRKSREEKGISNRRF